MNGSFSRSGLPVADRVRHLLIDIGLPPSALTGQADFARDLGMDSLDITDLLVQVETAFGVRITDRDGDGLRTIDAVVAYLEAEQHRHEADADPLEWPFPLAEADTPMTTDSTHKRR
jgi:acyl carrier protein